MLCGHTQRQQARALVDRAAHPALREELEEAGRALDLLTA